jgi:hypothetical protein
VRGEIAPAPVWEILSPKLVRLDGTFMEHSWNVYGTFKEDCMEHCMEHSWEHSWNIHATFMEHSWNIQRIMHGTFMEHSWNIQGQNPTSD